MKKVWTLLLIVALMGTLCACGSKAAVGGDNSAQNTTTAAAGETAAVKKGDPAKQAILVVSFGTSYNETRAVTLDAIERDIAAAYPDYEVRRAFTSQIIIDKLASRDNLKIDNVAQAMGRLTADGFGTLIVQPTHVMNGSEYDEMKAMVAPYEENFEKLVYGTPLLTSTEDYKEAVAAISAELPQLKEHEAIVFMGHGTEHFANATYAALEYMFHHQGHRQIYVGTVEGFPVLDDVKNALAENKVEKVYLLPFMIVAGDHANNDMAGDEEDSWKIQLKAEGFAVEPIIKGLGEYQGIRAMFAEHVAAAIATLG